MMKCNNCSNFSIGKLRVKANYNYGRKYYFIWLLKCMEMNVVLDTIKENQGLEDIFVPDVAPCWDCPGLRDLRKKDEIPHFELTIMKNGERMNDFSEFMKNN